MSVQTLNYASPGVASAKAPGPRTWWDPYIPPAFITLILLVGNWHFGILESPWKTVAAILGAMLTEVILGWLVVGKIPHLASAYITGISVAILVPSPYVLPYP